MFLMGPTHYTYIYEQWHPCFLLLVIQCCNSPPLKKNLLDMSVYHQIFEKRSFLLMIINIDRNTTYIFLVLFMDMDYNCFTNLIDHQFQLRC